MSLFALGHPSSCQLTTAAAISSHIGKLCYNSTHRHRRHLLRVYEELVRPCLAQKTHFITARKNHLNSITSVHVHYNDHARMHLWDYFSALGYILAHQPKAQHPGAVQLVQLLSLYASWTRISARALEINPPTVVQLLWTPSAIALAASVVPGKADVDELRAARTRAWPLSHALPRPTPVQQAHAVAGVCYLEPSAELFGTPWGHCGESVSFASMYKTMQSGTALGTLALSVKAMTTPLPDLGAAPTEAVCGLHRLQDVVEVLRVAGALRPMCLNCCHLAHSVSANLQDLAVVFSNPHSHLESYCG